MTSYEDALKWLQSECDDCMDEEEERTSIKCNSCEVADAIIAVMKQLPKKVIHKSGMQYYCGSCGNLICVDISGVSDFCPKCGQKLWWCINGK